MNNDFDVGTDYWSLRTIENRQRELLIGKAIGSDSVGEKQQVMFMRQHHYGTADGYDLDDHAVDTTLGIAHIICQAFSVGILILIPKNNQRVYKKNDPIDWRDPIMY